jgi:copper chaperone CopZ
MTIELKIEGMHCSGCTNAVRRVLTSVPSVSAVTVDLAAGSASIEAGADVDAAKLVSVVEEAGYEARIKT